MTTTCITLKHDFQSLFHIEEYMNILPLRQQILQNKLLIFKLVLIE